MKFSSMLACLCCFILMDGVALASALAFQTSPISAGEASPLFEWNGVGGEVTMTDGTSPVDVQIVISDTNGNPLHSVYPDSKGTYWFNYVLPDTYMVSANKPGYYASPAWGCAEVTAIVGGFAGPDFTLSPVVTFQGILKDQATGLPIRNGVVQVGARDSQAVVTGVTGVFSLCTGRAESVEIFADAPGYRASTSVGSALTSTTLDIELTPQVEPSTITNGGFEDVVDGKPVGWSVWDEDYGAVLTTTTDSAGGSYAGKVTSNENRSAIAYQKVPVVPGSAYNIYYKLKSETDVPEVYSGVTIYGGDEVLADWLSLSRDMSTLGCPAPLEWTQFLSTIRFSGSLSPKPLVRIIAPSTATAIQIDFGLVNGAYNQPRSIYVDDIVVDRIDPEVISSISQLGSKVGCYVILAGPNIVTCTPKQLLRGKLMDFFFIGERQGLDCLLVVGKPSTNLQTGVSLANLSGFVHRNEVGELYLEMVSEPVSAPATAVRPVGMTCKSVLTDPLAQLNLVRVWGKISYTPGWTVLTVSDGSKTLLKVYKGLVTVPDNLSGKTAALTGIVSKDAAGTPLLILSEPPRVF